MIYLNNKLTLKEARRIHGLTQRELSQRSKIAVITIQRIENPKEQLTATNEQTAEALAATLACTVDEIDWPHGLSNCGRPPHTGRPITKQPVAVTAFCETHHTILPFTGVCDDCNE